MYIISLTHENGKTYYTHFAKALKAYMSEYCTNATIFKTLEQAEKTWRENKTLLLKDVPDGEISIQIETIHTTKTKELSI